LAYYPPFTLTQCCCQGLETQGRGQGQGVKLQGQGQGLDVQGRGLKNWSSMIFEDKDFPRGQQHCKVLK